MSRPPRRTALLIGINYNNNPDATLNFDFDDFDDFDADVSDPCFLDGLPLLEAELIKYI